MASPKLTVFLVKVMAVFYLMISWAIAPHDKQAAVFWAMMAGFAAIIGVFLAHAVHRNNS